jgi:hypothetical protein
MECPFKRASQSHWNCTRSSTLGLIPHFNMQTKADQIFKTCKRPQEMDNVRNISQDIFNIISSGSFKVEL